MHFSSLAVSFLAALTPVYAASITVYNDAACRQQNQMITFSDADTYQCAEFKNMNSQGVIFSKNGFSKIGFNVWDSEYCDGDMAGSIQTLGKCLSAKDYGLAAWKSAHVAPRNTMPQTAP